QLRHSAIAGDERCARPENSSEAHNGTGSCHDLIPEVLIKDPEIVESTGPSMKDTERPEVPITEIKWDHDELEQEDAGGESGIVKVHAAEQQRGAEDQYGLAPLEYSCTFQVADHDRECQKLLNKAPGGIDNELCQQMRRKAECVLDGSDHEEDANDDEEYEKRD